MEKSSGRFTKEKTPDSLSEAKPLTFCEVIRMEKDVMLAQAFFKIGSFPELHAFTLLHESLGIYKFITWIDQNKSVYREIFLDLFKVKDPSDEYIVLSHSHHAVATKGLRRQAFDEN